ncbi:MAG TPA: GIY-YIG nuclease family protein [Candidatus Omnitrophota bacterium]|nr:GIY-YIG nuclease family protein [Candidatus Omnitrophota bacterium]
MFYVYVLKSRNNPTKHYVGLTSNLIKRIKAHNDSQSGYTKKYIPWEIVSFIGFKDFSQAAKFEKYLKSGSGYAFLRKRLVTPCKLTGPL